MNPAHRKDCKCEACRFEIVEDASKVNEVQLPARPMSQPWTFNDPPFPQTTASGKPILAKCECHDCTQARAQGKG